jgi:hypothetical protein
MGLVHGIFLWDYHGAPVLAVAAVAYRKDRVFWDPKGWDVKHEFCLKKALKIDKNIISWDLEFRS